MMRHGRLSSVNAGSSVVLLKFGWFVAAGCQWCADKSEGRLQPCKWRNCPSRGEPCGCLDRRDQSRAGISETLSRNGALSIFRRPCPWRCPHWLMPNILATC